MELGQYRDLLEFKFEQPLTAEPLRIDVLIIKKPKHVILEKNIAAIFRSVNIIEYKSPGDYVSVEDFYKVYGYACIYVSLDNHRAVSGQEAELREKTSVTDLTLSFVESRHPRELLAHLREVRGYGVEERSPGIYTIRGDIIPIQIIESRRLLEEENIWLRDLYNRLDLREINRISVEIGRLGKAAQIGAYLDAISRANSERIMEALQMGDSTLTLERIFEKTGLAAKWEARAKAEGIVEGKAEGKAEGEEKKARAIARILIGKGWSPEETAETTGLDIETVKSLD
jgi:hypothetical protein